MGNEIEGLLRDGLVELCDVISWPKLSNMAKEGGIDSPKTEEGLKLVGRRLLACAVPWCC